MSRKLSRLFSVVLATLLVTTNALAACNTDAMLKGVSVAGAEFNPSKLPGVLNKDYVYPNPAQLDYFAAAGINTIRLPFRWERIQPSLFGPLDTAEQAQLKTVVALATQRNLCVIFDVHNYGIYRGKVLGSTEVPMAAFIDLWTKLADGVGKSRFVAFGLMNEPHKLSIDQWSRIAQQTVNAIRESGAKNLLLVSGARWSGAHEWDKRIDGVSNADALANFVDPLRHTLIEVHQYADQHYSGTGQHCVPPAKITAIFDKLSRWAKHNGQQLFLGEFGMPANPACLEALDAMLAQMQNNPSWRGWTYWAAGSWWGTYPLSIEPRQGQDAPQMAVLRKYL